MPLSSQIRPEPNPPLERARVMRARDALPDVARHLYACLDGIPFGQDGERMTAIPRRRDVTGKRRRALKADDVSLMNRLTRTAERQVRDIETRLSARDVSPVERERDVRMLASLTRALCDLQALRKQSAAPRGSPLLSTMRTRTCCRPTSMQSGVSSHTGWRRWRPADLPRRMRIARAGRPARHS